MKVRNGFVSNSSSSSFILAYKGNKPKLDDFLIQLGAQEGSPAYKLLEPLAKHMLSGGKFDFEEYEQDYKDEPQEYWPKLYKKALEAKEKGFTVTEFSGSNEGDGPEQYFYNNDIDVVSDDVVIIGECQ